MTTSENKGRADNEYFGNLQRTIYRKAINSIVHIENFVSESGEPPDRYSSTRLFSWFTHVV
jgi:hypothetical protein